MRVVICTITLYNDSTEGPDYEIPLISELSKLLICMYLHSFNNDVLLFLFMLHACQPRNQRINGTSDQKIKNKIDQCITH
jgi:hypothetical protein